VNSLAFFLLMAAQEGGSSSSGGVAFLQFLPFIAIIYFLIIRPQNKKRKQNQNPPPQQPHITVEFLDNPPVKRAPPAGKNAAESLLPQSGGPQPQSPVNTNMVNIIRRIIREQGEAVLTDPARLKGFIADYASRESKAERIALGRCIEYGAYKELKNAPDATARQAAKAAIVRRVNTNEAIEPRLCNNALAALEAALFEEE
jgi:hypothetical protein